MSCKRYEIVPVPKPRMTQADRWKKRPCVLRYFDYKDKLREMGAELTNDSEIIFVLPMPKSWSMKKKYEMFRKPHQQRPDIDNLFKAYADAILDEDKHIYRMRAIKIWGDVGEIVVNEREVR